MADQARRLRDLVEARADGRCEYCRRYQDLIGETFFEVEHITPRARGGPTDPDNLAFACRHCNSIPPATTRKRYQLMAQGPADSYSTLCPRV
ncbi:MAG: HNH endonuclease [Anaerolineae bacterium]